VEAYVGLAAHIYHIDAGSEYIEPTTQEEYENNQVLSIRDQL